MVLMESGRVAQAEVAALGDFGENNAFHREALKRMMTQVAKAACVFGDVTIELLSDICYNLSQLAIILQSSCISRRVYRNCVDLAL